MTQQAGFFDTTCEDLALFSGTPVPVVLPEPKRKPAPRQLALAEEDLAVYDDPQNWNRDQTAPRPLWN